MIEPVIWDACVSSDSYSFSKAMEFSRLGVISGRPRYRLKDQWASYTVQCSMDLSMSEYNEWQTFWKGPASRGAKSFRMRLMLSSVDNFNELGEIYTVNVKEHWSASFMQPNRWKVDLTVEVPWTFGFLGTFCDIIYGGPLDDLSDVEIYGGPLTDLATDIIAPCEEVLNA